MVSPQYICDDPKRGHALRDNGAINGIDYLEVVDQDSPDAGLRQRTLLVFCFRPVAELSRDNIRIEGGERIPTVAVQWAHPANAIPAGLLLPAEIPLFTTLPNADSVLVIRTVQPGDFSTYRLRITASVAVETPPANYDPVLSALDFSFKIECPSDFDCAPLNDCPSAVYIEPELDYLSKDYASFRQLVIDRMSIIQPGWQERNPADIQLMLIELFAYVGDYLSYFQDSVATEAYLYTARRRASVQRHIRLLDYRMHEGCNARTWIDFEVNADVTVDPALPLQDVILLSNADGARRIAPADLGLALRANPVAFQIMHRRSLFTAHNRISIHTWGDESCCLPQGATGAALVNDPANPLQLQLGDVILFEEVISPITGLPADADRSHRQAVRLTEVSPATIDPLYNVEVINVTWDAEDALRFPLCVSALVRSGAGNETLTEIAVARGNLVLADHGIVTPLSTSELIGTVPEKGLFRPFLGYSPLTYAEPFDYATLPAAAAALEREPRKAYPQIAVNGDGALWTPVFDLLNSDRFSLEFVVEHETDGSASLRFGDGLFGRAVRRGSPFTATYRMGNGRAGNIGAEVLQRAVTALPEIDHVRNPLPASGGTDPEPMERARIDATQAFRTQERAVTEADYAAVAERNRREVQRAAASFRWTGSWYTAFVSIDRLYGKKVDPDFEKAMADFLEYYRMAGIDVEINDAVDVPLEIEIEICVKPGYFQSDVEAALMRMFNNRLFPSGGRGFFHPDNFTFQQPVYASQIYHAALAVDGVESVAITRFKRYGKPDDSELDDGVIAPGAKEIIRLDNDPNFPERGKLTFIMKGGIG